MHQQGVSLIEILISFFILSLLLFGLDAMQITILRETKSAYYFSVAAQQLDVMMERINTIKDKNMNESLMIWNKQNHDVLPQGRGEIKGSYPDFKLSIFWGDFTKRTCDKNKIGQSGCLYTIVKV